MKGSEKIIACLNDLLADELTAISQYMVHSEMDNNWGYEKLHKVVEGRAITEMKHAEKLIARILFLEGLPIVNKLKDFHIGSKVESQLQNDRKAEEGAVAAYNAGVLLAVEEKDNGTRELLSSILSDEEDHLDWLEAQQDQIDQMGIGLYLSEQRS